MDTETEGYVAKTAIMNGLWSLKAVKKRVRGRYERVMATERAEKESEWLP